MVHNTSFLCWREKSLIRNIRSGHGHTFKMPFKKDQLHEKMASTHHTVQQWNLGNLNLVVRHEVDAYYQSPSNSTLVYPTSAQLRYQGAQILTKHNKPTSIFLRGKEIESHKIAEIKTSRVGGDPSILHKDLPNFMQQLWFGRTPWLIHGQHEDGTFKSVEPIDAAREFVD